MGALHWRRPTAAELEGTRHLPEDYPEPLAEVWEENWDALLLYTSYMTQWRTGPGGVIGLDYNVIHHALDRKGITGELFDEYLWQIGVIEMAALKEHHKN